MDISGFRIRPIIIFLGLFMASMLFQTATNRVGTLIAFVLIALIIVCYFFEYGAKIRIGSPGILIFLFLLISTAVSLLRSGIPYYYEKLVAQIAVFVILLGTDKVNVKEEGFLVKIFLLSTIFYTVVGISERILSGAAYYQREMVLFGSKIDPNFFGIPIVAGATILLHLLLNAPKRNVIYGLGYIMLVVAIMYTASRGSFLALVIGNSMVLISFVFGKQINPRKKATIIVLMIIACIILFSYIQTNFLNAWERMTSIGQAGSDNGRFILWGYAIKSWLDYPLFGGGMYSYYDQYQTATHNTYFQVLSEEGLVGICMYLAVMFMLLKKTWQYKKLYFFIFLAMMVQIFFLDALDNRCVWSIMCWIAVLPSINGMPDKSKENENEKYGMRAGKLY